MLETEILTKLEQLTYYYEKFSVFLLTSLANYQKSLKDQMAIERIFQVSIECMMDISAEIGRPQYFFLNIYGIRALNSNNSFPIKKI